VLQHLSVPRFLAELRHKGRGTKCLRLLPAPVLLRSLSLKKPEVVPKTSHLYGAHMTFLSVKSLCLLEIVNSLVTISD
jgi:hypothetical protein